uniref:Putative radical SAM superfamily protein n=1 Tax=viral metagenome TaxID=1070528 RepID=A0A6M3L9C2_9ZZZZ
MPPSPWLITDREIPFYGILSVASYLKMHMDCEVQVCDLSSLPKEKWFIPVGDIYGVTGVTPNFVYIRDIIKIIKDREPDKPVIVGGVHATVCPDSILEKTLADACIIGEGEITAYHIMNGVNWREIPGIITREFNTGFPELIPNLDALPLPDRNAIDYYSYLPSTLFNYLDTSVKREGSLFTARGCYFNCSFCCSKKIHHGRVRLRSAESVVDEFIYLRKVFDIDMVNVLDDTFTLDRKRAYKICDLLVEKKVGMKWFCLVRVDDVDYEVLSAMKKAGCLSIAPGFETGSNRILKLMNKKMTIDTARACVEAAYKAGVMINAQLIVGFPTETDEDVELTAKFIRDNPEIDTFGLHTFQPFPGCDVWEHPEKYDIVIDKDTDFMDYQTVGNHQGLYHKDPIIDGRFRYLHNIIGNKSRELRRKLLG